MTAKELLLQQLNATNDQEDWFVPLKGAVEGLTAEQALWVNGPTNNSIDQIVRHLLFWNLRYLRRFKKLEVSKTVDSNDITFSARDVDGTGGDWNSVITRLLEVNTEWCEAINATSDEELDKHGFPNQDAPSIAILGAIATHNAYHVGQIVTIRKAQGSWPEKR